MRAGLLRNRVTIQTRSESTDDFGEIDFSWSNSATVWATIEPLSGKELMNAQQAGASVSHKISMRYKSGVNPKDRISYDSRTFEIESVRNFRERDISLELMCREEV
jgi:SPP1 family predicted phage head-tail adaptor